MDLSEALGLATGRITQEQLAKRLGVNVQRIRQALLASDHPGHRPAPAGWQTALAELARERGAELARLADRLDPPA